MKTIFNLICDLQSILQCRTTTPPSHSTNLIRIIYLEKRLIFSAAGKVHERSGQRDLPYFRVEIRAVRFTIRSDFDISVAVCGSCAKYLFISFRFASETNEYTTHISVYVREYKKIYIMYILRKKYTRRFEKNRRTESTCASVGLIRGYTYSTLFTLAINSIQ